MKNLFTALIMTTLTVFYSAVLHADTSILGKWSGVDSDGDSATFLFNEDNSAEVKFEGTPPLTSRNLTNGSVGWAKNDDHNPMHLDIIIFIDSEEKRRIPMVAEFVDDQTMKIQMSRDMSTRPDGFEMTKDVFQILVTKQ